MRRGDGFVREVGARLHVDDDVGRCHDGGQAFRESLMLVVVEHD
jgi:hypothetical protein